MRNKYILISCLVLGLTFPDLLAQNLLDDAGRKTGPWKAYYPDSSLRYEGTFAAGKPVGEMKRYHPGGALAARLSYSEDSRSWFARL